MISSFNQSTVVDHYIFNWPVIIVDWRELKLLDHVKATLNLSEADMVSVEDFHIINVFAQIDEELGGVHVLTGIGHGQKSPCFVLVLEAFVFEVFRPFRANLFQLFFMSFLVNPHSVGVHSTCTITFCVVTGLYNETFDDSMDFAALVAAYLLVWT